MTAKARKPPPGRLECEVLAACYDAFAVYGVVPERRNTGAAVNPKGQLVTFGTKGDSDLTGIFPAHFGAAAGKRWDCEVKREGFDPAKLRGKAREHFDRQLERLKRVNEAGGYGWWVNDASQVLHVLERVKQGWRIVFEGDMPYLDDGKDE